MGHFQNHNIELLIKETRSSYFETENVNFLNVITIPSFKLTLLLTAYLVDEVDLSAERLPPVLAEYLGLYQPSTVRPIMTIHKLFSKIGFRCNASAIRIVLLSAHSQPSIDSL
jgi:hypothetical protein